jgi:hypothetical protein
LEFSHSVKLLGRLFVVSVGLNYPWEVGQAFLYVGMTYSLAMLGHCFVAALGDGVLIWIIYLLGWMIFRTADWFTRPGWQRYMVMLSVGLVIGLAVEWLALHLLARWSYTDRMPMIPWLGIGWVPVLQMVLMPPLIFAITGVGRKVSRPMNP